MSMSVEGIALTTLVALAASIGVVHSVATVNSRESTTITVTDKERVRSGDSDKYLVFAEEGTYEITDSFLAGQFDSSDIYGAIEPGATYAVEHQGWRIPFLSAYPNLIELEEVAP